MTAETSPATANGKSAPDPERLAALVEFAAAAGHEINNPLAVILGRTQLLMHQETDPLKRQALSAISGQAQRIRDMIGDLMMFADPPRPVLESVCLAEIVTTTSKLFDADANRKNTHQPLPQLEVELEPGLKLSADRDQLATILAELFLNALHPGVAASRVQFGAKTNPGQPDRCSISVRDNGTGLTPEQSVFLFDPFYCGRQAGRGLGFGLCKVWRLVTQHNATIRVISKIKTTDNSFKTEFLIDWPKTT